MSETRRRGLSMIAGGVMAGAAIELGYTVHLQTSGKAAKASEENRRLAVLKAELELRNLRLKGDQLLGSTSRARSNTIDLRPDRVVYDGAATKVIEFVWYSEYARSNVKSVFPIEKTKFNDPLPIDPRARIPRYVPRVYFELNENDLIDPTEPNSVPLPHNRQITEYSIFTSNDLNDYIHKARSVTFKLDPDQHTYILNAIRTFR